MGRPLLALTVASLALTLAPSAYADDLLLLGGDSVTISGTVHYGFVYVDGQLNLAGDTSIDADSIYIGPNASLQTCYVGGVGSNGCTAGRSLTLRSSGRLTVDSRIDLTGGAGTYQPGGSLSLVGAPITVGGDITTAGSGGAPSGAVSIFSNRSLAVGAIDAPGARVSLSARDGIDVGGDIDTEGSSGIASADPSREQFAGPVTVSSTAGDVHIDGNVNAYGRDAPTAGALGGGNGAPVSITGSAVRAGGIDTTGGSSAAGPAGTSGTITVTARTTLDALGRLDAGGQNGAAGGATPGQRVQLTAAGPLTLGGGIDTSGAQGPAGGSPGGAVSLSGYTVTGGTVDASGGNAPAGTAAGSGGTITISAPAGASLGSLLAYGGNAYSGGVPGHGGAVALTSAAGSIAVDRVLAQAGYTSNGPAPDGGPVTLSAHGDLTVGGAVDTSGADANGTSDPARAGGNGGAVTVRAATGTLNLGADISSGGGRGGSDSVSGHSGGAGGNAGRIDIVAHALGSIAAVLATGGSGGDYGHAQGPGGAGGAIVAWTDAPVFDDQKVVDNDGGDGNPVGAAGERRQDSSPASPLIDPTSGLLSFTSRSPDAQRYVVLASTAGRPPAVVLQSIRTSGLKPKTPLCTAMRLTVVAVGDGGRWTSDPSPAVTYRRSPSGNQSCSAAPGITAAARTVRSLRALRRARWTLAVPVKANGAGILEGALTHGAGRRGGGPPLASAAIGLLGPGRHTLRLRLPAAAHSPGSYVLKLTAFSPDGKRHVMTTMTLEIVR